MSRKPIEYPNGIENKSNKNHGCVFFLGGEDCFYIILTNFWYDEKVFVCVLLKPFVLHSISL